MPTSYEFLRRSAWGGWFDRRIEPLGRGPPASLWALACWAPVYGAITLLVFVRLGHSLALFLPIPTIWLIVRWVRHVGGTEVSSRGQARWARDASSHLRGEDLSFWTRLGNALLAPREVQLLALLLPLAFFVAAPFIWDDIAGQRRGGVAFWVTLWPYLRWPLLVLGALRLYAVMRAVFAPVFRVTYVDRPYVVEEPLAIRFGLSSGGATLDRVDLQLCCVTETWFPWWGSFRTEVDTCTRQLPVDAALPGLDGDVDVRFAAMPGCPGTRLATATPTYWELRVKAWSGRTVHRAIFLLPVYSVTVRRVAGDNSAPAASSEANAGEPMMNTQSDVADRLDTVS